MSVFRRFLTRLGRAPGVDKIRRAVGRFASPGLQSQLSMLSAGDDDLRDHITALYKRSLDDNHRLAVLETELTSKVEQLDRHLPAVLNAISSTNGAARLLRREIELFAERVAVRDGVVEEHLSRLDAHIQDELWPLKARAEGLDDLYKSVSWLMERVELVRAEMLHELRYSSAAGPVEIDVEVVNAAAVEVAQGSDALRLNLGCGHIPLEGYVNIDMRRLPGVDVVAPVDNLPFEPGTVGEIFSAHVLEHFPQAELERRLLPYWHSLLTAGGVLRSVVPDIDAMIDQYHRGEITFENLREVAYGGQEYEGDFHHTAFTPESLSGLLLDAGFEDVDIVERGRPNGACLEFELTARRRA